MTINDPKRCKGFGLLPCPLRLLRRDAMLLHTWDMVRGFGVWGVGSSVWGLGIGVWGLGFGVWGLEFGVWGSEFRVWGLGCAIWGSPRCRAQQEDLVKGAGFRVECSGLRVES